MKNPSRLVYDITGRGFTRFRGSVDVENARAEIGSTLNPPLRFFVFDAEPNMDRLLPPVAGRAAAGPGHGRSRRGDVVDRVFCTRSAARRRRPSGSCRKRRSRTPPCRDRSLADGVADLLWAVLMKPEFQLIY